MVALLAAPLGCEPGLEGRRDGEAQALVDRLDAGLGVRDQLRVLHDGVSLRWQFVLLGPVEGNGVLLPELQQQTRLPGHEALKGGGEEAPEARDEAADPLLLRDGGEDQLPGAEVDEALFVFAQKTVEEGGAAAGVAHDEDGLLDGNFVQAGSVTGRGPARGSMSRATRVTRCERACR